MISNLAVTEFTDSALIVWGLRKLQSAKWFPWLKHEYENMRVLASGFLAALAAVGTQWTWDSSTHTLTIVNITFTTVALAFWHWLNHFAIQETIQAAIPKPQNPAQ